MSFEPAAAQRPVLPLATLLQQAESTQESIQLQRLAVEQARSGEITARAARLPRVDVTGSYLHVSEVGHITLAIPGLFSRSIAFGDGNIYETSIGVSMPVFTGFRLQHAEAAQEQQRIAGEHTLAATIADVRAAVIRQYRLAQLARVSGEILAAQEALLADLLAVRSRLVAQAQALPLDTLQLSTRIAAIRVDRVSAMSTYERAILSLMQLTGATARFDVPVFEGLTTGLEVQSSDALLATALATRPELRALDAQRSAADHTADMARGSYLPSIVVSAAYKYGRPGVDQFANTWMSYYTAGVRLDWNLWNWGADRAQVERAELESRRSDLRTQQVRTQIRTSIDLTIEDLRVRRATLDLLERQILLEQNKLTQVQARLREGLATTSDLVDAETSLTTALLRREQTRIEFAIKQTDLAAAVGVQP